jgi:Xaa-Pro aminopeptidase
MDPGKNKMFEAASDAREAMLQALRPGVTGGDLDQAARTRIDSHGLVHLIKHASGHGAGFGALDHTARPRLHPKSDDVIQAGMILTLDTGLYSEEHGGVRNADMVAVTDSGPELLTDFHRQLSELAIHAD